MKRREKRQIEGWSYLRIKNAIRELELFKWVHKWNRGFSERLTIFLTQSTAENHQSAIQEVSDFKPPARLGHCSRISTQKIKSAKSGSFWRFPLKNNKSLLRYLPHSPYHDILSTFWRLLATRRDTWQPEQPWCVYWPITWRWLSNLHVSF